MFEGEYVTLVIKPKIDLILEDGVESIADLTAKFNSTFDCKVSKSRVTQWLKDIGYRVSRKVQIERPGRSRSPAVTEDEDLRRPAPVEEFRTQHRQEFFNFAPPAGMFTNVPMPGFSE